MKLFYFGSVCDKEIFNETVNKSKVKPSASAQNFEYALIKGFSENQSVDITVASAESIAAFPKGNRLFLKKRRDKLTDRCFTSIIPAVNLPLLKQFGHSRGAARLLKKWLKENQDVGDKCVLVYGLYTAVAKKLLKVCRKNNCKIFAVITDIPATMFTYTNSKNIFKRLFSGAYRKKAIELQDKFDGYVFLTDAMSDAVAKDKPYVLVETIADTEIFNGLENVEKSSPKAIMYAGALYQKYGLDLILDTFEKIKSDCELWLFGSGDYEAEIIKRAESNAKIKFFGRVSRDEILKKEREATLLINLRNVKDEYTKYSFPSKMVEYMLSATPIVTTKLEGIPDEYDSYSYTTREVEPGKIAEYIDSILSKGKEQIRLLGERAKKFIIENKNSAVQTKRIADFLSEQL